MRIAHPRLLAAIVAAAVLGLAHVSWPGMASAALGDIAVGGVWICRLTQGAAGLTLEQRVSQVEQRITEVLSVAMRTGAAGQALRPGRVTVDVQPVVFPEDYQVGEAATIVSAGIAIITVIPADAAGTGVSVYELANQWAGRLVQGLRRALPGREIIGRMYTQPRGSEAGRLVGITWSWRGTLMNDGARFQPHDPSRYTVQFTSNGGVVVRADCNRGKGAYTLRGHTITIPPLAVTRAMCPPGSLDQRFVRDLGEAYAYSIRAGILLVELKFDSGTMRLTQLQR
jgi:heat shock protein HslJ